jgi:Spy/CpxP family protein refolding chaperone
MRSKTGAGLVLLLTFAMGAVSGAIGHYLYRSRVSTVGAHLADRGGGRDSTDEMAKGLKLSEEQKGKLRAIITQSRERYRALSQQFRPEYETLRQQTRREIREILTDEQRENFEKMIRERDSRPKGSRHREAK